MHAWLPVLLSRILSILQASTLRDRYYTLLNRQEILDTALQDIERIAASDATDARKLQLISSIVENTIKITRP
jgi:hypothetical protein